MEKINIYKCTKSFFITNYDLLIECGTEWYLSNEFINPYRLISLKDWEWIWIEIGKEELEQHFKLLAQY